MLSAMSEDLEAAKRRLRRAMSAQRRAVSPEAADSAARRVAAQLLGAEEFDAAPRVALYADHAGELPTRACFDAVLRAGKTHATDRVIVRAQPSSGKRFAVQTARRVRLRCRQVQTVSGYDQPSRSPGYRRARGLVVDRM